MDDTSFSLRHNAKRAAERAIEAGTAASIDYRIHTREDGRFEVVWKTGCESPTTAEIEEEITTAIAEADEPAATEIPADPWPAGTRVAVALSKRRTRSGTVDYRVDGDHWRVFLDGAPPTSNLYSGDQLSPTDAAPPEPKPIKKERRVPAQPTDRKPSRSAEVDAAAAQGIMPEKPIVTSKANPHYQKRFDHLADRASAGDWDAVRGYEVKGINSYAKMVKQYRDRLLAAHAAQSPEAAT
jgi:hypothetical protein